MKTTVKGLAVTGIISLSAAAMSQTWNLASDYAPGLVTPENGAWTYGQYLGSSVFQMTPWNAPTNSYGIGAAGNAFIYQRTAPGFDYGLQQGQVGLEADWGNPSVRWTAPSTGVYTFNIEIGGTTANGPGGYGNNFATFGALKINGADNTNFQFSSTTNIKSWSFTQSLNFGDTVDAVVFNPGYANGGSTRTDFVVTEAVPEPASMAALGLGVLGLIRRRGQRA